jgi:hypothetical protein
MNIFNRILCLIGSIALLFIMIQFHIAYTFLYIITMFAGGVSSMLLGEGGLGLHTLGIDIVRMIFKPFRIILYLNLSQSKRNDLYDKDLNIFDDIKAACAPGRVSLCFGVLAIIFAILGML